MKKGQFTKNQNNQLIVAPIVEGVDRELFNDDGQCFKAGYQNGSMAAYK